jgi:hypothetical protein
LRAPVFLLFLVSFVDCGGDSRRPPAALTRDHELPAAQEAYRAYCGLCPRSASCCLGEADFARARWSEVAGRYLRALREHYECMRGDTLVDQALYEDPPKLPDAGRSYVPVENTARLSCERYACMASGEVMTAELDRALDVATPHAEGALLACPAAANLAGP